MIQRVRMNGTPSRSSRHFETTPRIERSMRSRNCDSNPSSGNRRPRIRTNTGKRVSKVSVRYLSGKAHSNQSNFVSKQVLDWKLDFLETNTAQIWKASSQDNRITSLCHFCLANILYFSLEILRHFLSKETFLPLCDLIYLILIGLNIFVFVALKTPNTVTPILFKRHNYTLSIFLFCYPSIILCSVGLFNSIFQQSTRFDGFSFCLDCLYLYVFNLFFMVEGEIPFSCAVLLLALGGSLLIIQYVLRFPGDPIGCVLLGFHMLSSFGVYYICFNQIIHKFSIESQTDWLIDQQLSTLGKAGKCDEHSNSENIKDITMVFAQMAHDIGTPLSALAMGAELLEFEYKKCRAEHGDIEIPRFEETIEAIQASVAIISVLRQSMLDSSKQACNLNQVPSLEPINISELVEKKVFLILRQLLSKRKKSSVTPMWRVDEALCDVELMTAKNWILDMLLNFCSNAVKFTEDGFIRISVVHTATNDKDMVRFEVEDSGKGIKSDKVENLFSKFGQLQGNRGGTGIGLYSVKTKAEMLGGYAGYTPGQNGTGSIFYFAIPFVISEPGGESQGYGRDMEESFTHGKQGRVVELSEHRQLLKPSPKESSKYRKNLSSPKMRLPSPKQFIRSKSSEFNLGTPSEKPRIAPPKDLIKSKSGEFSLMRSLSKSSSLVIANNLKNMPTSDDATISRTRYEEPLSPIKYAQEKARPGTMSLSASYSPKPQTFRSSEIEVCVGVSRLSSGSNSISNCNSQSNSGSSGQNEEKNSSTPSSQESPPNFATMSVFIVEDSPMLCNFYSRILGTFGVSKIVSCESGEQFLEVFNETPKLITRTIFLFDDQLPGIRGIELVPITFELCQQHGIEQADIYVCSGSHPEALQEKFPEQACLTRAIIQKPLTRALLGSILSGKFEENDGKLSNTHKQTRILKASRFGSICMDLSLENPLPTKIRESFFGESVNSAEACSWSLAASQTFSRGSVFSSQGSRKTSHSSREHRGNLISPLTNPPSSKSTQLHSNPTSNKSLAPPLHSNAAGSSRIFRFSQDKITLER